MGEVVLCGAQKARSPKRQRVCQNASGTRAFCFVLFRVFRGSLFFPPKLTDDPRNTRNNTNKTEASPRFDTLSAVWGIFAFCVSASSGAKSCRKLTWHAAGSVQRFIGRTVY